MPREPSLPFAPAAERNAGPILAELRRLLQVNERVLEIGSGTGQHAVHFAAAMPALRWQPSDRGDVLSGLAARIAFEGTSNVAAPCALDVICDPWPKGPFDTVFGANVLHIFPLGAVAALFQGAATVLAPGGKLVLYGPVAIEGEEPGTGNRRFDQALRAADPAQGIRELRELDDFAAIDGLEREALVPMPANNHLMLWRKPT